ncbi:MAG: hypothetical protein JWR18_969 [Segetibacter sp.]|jgi:hypothetical protein|nr:hypothetical protein [Segetibacter sp.]
MDSVNVDILRYSDAIPVSFALDTSLSADALKGEKELVDKGIYLTIRAVVIVVGLIAKVLVLLISLITNISFMEGLLLKK